jgi:hypothetical protein
LLLELIDAIDADDALTVAHLSLRVALHGATVRCAVQSACLTGTRHALGVSELRTCVRYAVHRRGFRSVRSGIALLTAGTHTHTRTQWNTIHRQATHQRQWKSADSMHCSGHTVAHRSAQPRKERKQEATAMALRPARRRLCSALPPGALQTASNGRMRRRPVCRIDVAGGGRAELCI